MGQAIELVIELLLTKSGFSKNFSSTRAPYHDPKTALLCLGEAALHLGHNLGQRVRERASQRDYTSSTLDCLVRVPFGYSWVAVFH